MPRRFLTLTGMLSAVALLVAACLPADDARPSNRENGFEDAVHADTALGYTVKLEFRIVHPEEAPTFYTHSAGGDFRIQEDISEPNHEHSLLIDGSIAAGDDNEGLLLNFDVQTHHSDFNEGFDATHSVAGSVLIAPGNSKTLARLGDAALEVTATREE